MNDIIDNVEHLEKKIQKLVNYHQLLRESNNKLADENKKLAERLEKEIDRAKHFEEKARTAKPGNSSVNVKELKSKVQNIIQELDNSLNMLSTKSESTL
jgi:regulator of replication initiation timing